MPHNILWLIKDVGVYFMHNIPERQVSAITHIGKEISRLC